MEDQRQDPLVARIGGDDADVPVAASGAHQLHDLFSGDLALVENAVAAAREQAPLQLGTLLQISLEQPVPDIAQRVPPLRDRDDLHRQIHFPAGQDQLLGGLARLFEGGMLRVDTVGGQAHGDPGGHPDQVAHDGHMLPGQVREAVYVKFVVFRKIALLQLLEEPVHLIPGVRLALGADAVVALQNQSQLLQLLGQRALRLLRRQAQVRACDAAALEFVHRIQ